MYRLSVSVIKAYILSVIFVGNQPHVASHVLQAIERTELEPGTIEVQFQTYDQIIERY